MSKMVSIKHKTSLIPFIHQNHGSSMVLSTDHKGSQIKEFFEYMMSQCVGLIQTEVASNSFIISFKAMVKDVWMGRYLGYLQLL